MLRECHSMLRDCYMEKFKSIILTFWKFMVRRTTVNTTNTSVHTQAVTVDLILTNLPNKDKYFSPNRSGFRF